MEKFEGKYTFEQARGIIKFIDKDGCFRIGNYNDNPVILIGFECTEVTPEEFTRVHISKMMDKEFEIHSKNELNESAKKMESRLNNIRGSLTKRESNSMQIKRVEAVSLIEEINSNFFETISNGEDIFAIYITPQIFMLEEPSNCEKIKLVPIGQVLSKVRKWN